MNIKRALIFLFSFLAAANAAHAQQQAMRSALMTPMLEDWLHAFQNINRTASGDALSPMLVFHLNELDGLIQSKEDIETFRKWTNDDKVVEVLIPLSAGTHPETRIPATLVLGNVVDNTNVCLVIAHLAQTNDLDVNGQFNLLQVVRQVADYAFVETSGWIVKLVDLKKGQIKGAVDMGSTEKLLSRIRQALPLKPTGSLAELAQDKFLRCSRLMTLAFPEAIEAELSANLIRDWLFSSERQEHATRLAERHAAADANEQTRIVDMVIAAIIPPREDPERRYRVNLYIALTISRMTSGALTKPEQREALIGLRNTPEYREDPTFRDNVDRAIARQMPLQ